MPLRLACSCRMFIPQGDGLLVQRRSPHSMNSLLLSITIEYVSTAADTEDYLRQLHRILPERPVDDLSSSTFGNRRQSPSESR
jgi:hypothetical protein